MDITDGSNEIMLFSDAGRWFASRKAAVAPMPMPLTKSTPMTTPATMMMAVTTARHRKQGHLQGVRPMGRTAAGVRGIKLGAGDKVSLIVPRGDGAILTATENGYGKRTRWTSTRPRAGVPRASSPSRWMSATAR